MSTYCIGDIQGCFDELEQLLKVINYDYHNDSLWFVGDLVNRGPKSLEVLRFIKDLPNTKIILGNHDLHLLNLYNKTANFNTSYLKQILIAPDGKKLIEWLKSQFLIYYDQKYNCVLVHAGIYPQWDLISAIKYAKEVEKILHSEDYLDFLKHGYGNKPSIWHEDLRGWDRYRFITNAFMRMRFCDLEGNLEFDHAGKADTAPPGYLPWFKIPWRKTKNIKIIFGHWAALEGATDDSNIIPLDTGCVWGGSLTALRIEDGVKFSYRYKQKQRFINS
ncbi:MAG: symmetrical bis(5'-nucleosyl)-tetraphosphatase [Coxiellaceae bacterium]|jgi:bis(5'-nucleosyl)-tetraphosphatase (symmetrical)|nr:symmetrical bis(5'-nucleosyl)-tetraphosphatase [Coxiellaceae bacterium]